MKRVHLVLSTLLLCLTLNAYAARQIVPAGSLINCTISEAKLSSKTAAVGDPVLCSVGITTRNGSARLPFDSYLEGRFEDFKDPGHFVGKGWMELKFDRMVVEPRTVIPVSARVIDAPGYHVDQQGRILGKGHRTRDIVEWCIPILWPIDLLNLPRRGPRPTLKAETRLVVKVMDDMEVPIIDEPDQDPSGLYHRQPSAYYDPPSARPQPQYAQDDPPQPAYQPPVYQYQPPQQSYAQPAPMPVYMPVVPMYMAVMAPMVYYYPAPPPAAYYGPPSPAYYAPPSPAYYAPPPAAPVYMYGPPVAAMRAPHRTIYPNTIAAYYPHNIAAYRPVMPYGY